MYHYKRLSYPRRILLVACALGLTAGCTDLRAIRDFADISAESAAYTRIVEDYVEAPARQKAFWPEQYHKRLEDRSEQRAQDKDRLLLRLTLVKEYMDSIGALASDELVTYDKEVDALGKAAKEAQFATEEADAFGKISKILLKALTDAWRKRQLSKVITAAHPHLKVVLNNMKNDLAGGYFGLSLQNEISAMESHYTELKMLSEDPAGIAALEELKARRILEAKERQNALEAYRGVLGKIEEGHEKLSVAATNLDSKELLAEISRHARQIRELFNIVRTI